MDILSRCKYSPKIFGHIEKVQILLKILSRQILSIVLKIVKTIHVLTCGMIRQRDQEKEVELKKLSEVILILIIRSPRKFFCQMNKKKLLEDMAEEESRNDSKLVELQKQRENERRILNSR